MNDPASSLDHRPTTPWQFDESVAACFADMLGRSVPDLAGMRGLVEEVGSGFIQYQTDVVDLGAADGEMLARFLDLKGGENHYVAVEPAPAFVARLRSRFAEPIRQDLVRVVAEPVNADEYPRCRASLTLAVLTLQFCPVESRLGILRKALDSTGPGGAIVLVEKVAGSSPATDRLLRSLYYDFKSRAGYSHDAIALKSRSLRHILAPLPAAWNEELLRRAGWGSVECFWRNRNFAGWVAVKE